jgi:hypothetical protein
MIQIIFAIVVENVTNPLHQIVSEHLPQVDFTFGVGDIVGSIALLVSAFTFYIAHTQASQSEQIKTCKDLWASINEKLDQAYDLKEKGADSKEVDTPLTLAVDELDYFAYLVLRGEIKDKVVLDYYKNKFITYIEKYVLDIVSQLDPKNSFKYSAPSIGILGKKWDAEWLNNLKAFLK